MTSLPDGFAVIEACCTPSECSRIAAHLDSETGPGTRCLLDRDWCRSLATSLRSRVAGTIAEIATLVAVQCTYFNKSSDDNWFVAFHQDRSIPLSPRVDAADWPGWSRKEGMTFVHGPDDLLARMLAVRLHIDDCTRDNGPLRVIPGSHLGGTRTTEEVVTLRDSLQDIELTARRGDVVVMHPLLLHASAKSRTLASRRVLHYLFGPRTLPAGLAWPHAV